jgi:hypothetical protein
MQPNTITLNVDILNNGTTVPESYERFEEFQNRAKYIGASHVPEDRDTVDLYRSFPVKSGNFKGVSKTTVKLTKDGVVSGVDGIALLTAPIILEVSFSIPVGTPVADILIARQRAIALLDLDVVMNALNVQLMV